jgi:hypothetical protein
MAMKNRVLGRTGVSVSPLCLGAMMFGPWGNKDEADSIRIIHRALDAGINFVDTADVYSGGESERIVGKALAGRRDDVVLATKFFMPMDGGDPNQRGGSRRWIIREVENSLRRLDTDYIDLYQVHRPSQDTDVEETLGALTDLVRQGKVRYIGSSSYAASQIVDVLGPTVSGGHEFLCLGLGRRSQIEDLPGDHAGGFLDRPVQFDEEGLRLRGRPVGGQVLGGQPRISPDHLQPVAGQQELGRERITAPGRRIRTLPSREEPVITRRDGVQVPVLLDHPGDVRAREGLGVEGLDP